MGCEELVTGCEFEEKVSRLIDGELSEDETEKVTAHIETCSSCRIAREEFLSVGKLIRAHNFEAGLALQQALTNLSSSDISTEMSEIADAAEQIVRVPLENVPVQDRTSETRAPAWQSALAASHIAAPASGPTSIAHLDLLPIPGKKYWNCERGLPEEFIYFVMPDRFHDDQDRRPVSTPDRSEGGGTSEQRKKFCGGTINGIRNHLDYIQGLGCTALWLSPVFENNENSYHGYAIQNYLNVDPRFGTKQDLIGLVEEAHARDMRVFLDVVLNHSGDNWAYPGDVRCYYDDDKQYEFGYFRREDRPLPVELRDPKLYHRRGEIGNFDDNREAERGDFCTLKDFNNDECEDGRRLQEILIKVHCYWLRELDIDGFRLDAVRHMPALAVARFCTAMKDYATSIGKRGFSLFGELVGDYDAIKEFMVPIAAGGMVYAGMDSALDFPLYFDLPRILKGLGPPGPLIRRYESLRDLIVSVGQRYLVGFIDNHDQIGQDYKLRFAARSPDEQVIAGIGYLLCALGTPCIYYGTEQGFSGEGNGDWHVRETMFDLADPEKNYLNPDCRIYRAIAQIAAIRHKVKALQAGHMFFRQISGNSRDFDFPWGQPCTLAFSRVLFDQEVLIAYNTSTTDDRQDYVIVDSQVSASGMRFLYGGNGEIKVLGHRNGPRFVRLELRPLQFVILGNESVAD